MEKVERIDTLDAPRAVHRHRPARLFIAQNGPRTDHPEDAEKCRRTRAIATVVDWPCEAQTCFQERNLGVGCGCAVS